jgi:cobalt-zinc-cadmium efflux system outer membrane protein
MKLRTLGAGLARALTLACVATLPTSATASPLDGVQPTASLTLEEAIVRAVRSSPLTAAAQVRAEGAEAAAQRVRRLPNPVFELRSENWGNESDLPLDTFAVLTQPLELGGKAGARRAVAGAERTEAFSDVRLARQHLVLSVCAGYLGALRASEWRTLLGGQRDSLADIVGAMRRRVEEGVAPEADLRKFEAELARTEDEVLRASLDLDAALAALSAWIGEAAVDATQLVLPSVAPPAPVPEEAWTSAIASRADVVAAQARARRAQQALVVERALAWPDLELVGGYKRTSGFSTGVAAVLMSIPLADRNGAAIARAEAEARAAVLDAEQATRLARAEIAVLLRSAAALRERAAGAEARLIGPADVVRQAARAAFREGTFDVLRVLDAERAWTEARHRALVLRLDATLAALRARIALGQEVTP